MDRNISTITTNTSQLLSIEAASRKYQLITVADTAANVNSEYGITPQVQLAMANGNTQFIIELARQFKYNVTIPTIALQIAAKFFHLKCYINYDRFVVLVSCLMIAAKFKDMEVGLKKLCFCTYNVLSKRLCYTKVHNQMDLNKIRQQVCIAECEVLRTLEFEIDTTNPNDYVRKYCDLCYTGIFKRKDLEYNKVIFDIVRIIILDSNRAQCSLYFTPLTIFIACFMIASHYQKLKPFAYLKKDHEAKNDQQLYSIWLNRVSLEEGESLSQQKILQCIRRLNHIIGIPHPPNQ